MNPAATDVWVRSRVTPAREGSATIERVGPFTPYLTQTIVEDAVAGGPGTSVHLRLWGDEVARLTILRLRRRVGLLAGCAVHIDIVRCIKPPIRPPTPDRSVRGYARSALSALPPGGQERGAGWGPRTNLPGKARVGSPSRATGTPLKTVAR